MPASWPLFAVLGSAFVYTIAALCTKRALSGGATVWQVNFAANMAMAVLYLPFWLGVDFPRLLAQGYKPILAAITFFIGQLFTFAALRKGDVSVATPLLGAKVIFVALLTSVLFGEAVGIKWWLAALICTVGIFLVTGSQRRTEGWTRHSGKTAAYSLIAAACLRPHRHCPSALVTRGGRDQLCRSNVFLHRHPYVCPLRAGRWSAPACFRPGECPESLAPGRPVACSAESGGYPRDPVFRRRDGGQYRLQFTVRPKRRDGLGDGPMAWQSRGHLAPKHAAAASGWLRSFSRRRSLWCCFEMQAHQEFLRFGA